MACDKNSSEFWDIPKFLSYEKASLHFRATNVFQRFSLMPTIEVRLLALEGMQNPVVHPILLLEVKCCILCRFYVRQEVSYTPVQARNWWTAKCEQQQEHQNLLIATSSRCFFACQAPMAASMVTVIGKKRWSSCPFLRIQMRILKCWAFVAVSHSRDNHACRHGHGIR